MRPRGKVIIAKRGREEYLRTCLHYLNEANSSDNYDITVVVVDDGDSNVDRKLFYQYISVHYTSLRSNSPLFNKSLLINWGIKELGDDFDWISIVDIDMVYSPNFFDSVYRPRPGNPYIISFGAKLDKHISDIVMVTQPRYREIDLLTNSSYFPEAPSQVTMSRKTLDIFSDVFKEGLFHDGYIGWGGEDSDLSFRARSLSKVGLVNKYLVPSMWYHLWHEDTKDEIQFKKNLSLFESRLSKNKKMIERYLEKNENSNSNMQISSRDKNVSRT